MSIRDHCDDIHRIYGLKTDTKIQYKLKLTKLKIITRIKNLKKKCYQQLNHRMEWPTK